MRAAGLLGVKRAAAERWVAAVNADGSYGQWGYAVAKKVAEVGEAITRSVETEEH